MSDAPAKIRFPTGTPAHPLLAIARRFAIALLLVVLNWLLVLVEADGYRDAVDGNVSAIDALYYTTVTLSTTGYGDITPVTQSARLINAVLVTPMRLLFVLVLVGTTIQVLTERSRDAFVLQRWRKSLKNHIVVVGFGTKGRSAVRELIERGTPPTDIVVVDPDYRTVDDAHGLGVTSITGDGTKDSVLSEAGVEKAQAVIIAASRDDTAVLATLSSRRQAPKAMIVVSVREQENVDLVRQSGADSVIVTADTAGRLLGMATSDPATVAVAQDLISFGEGLDLVQRDVRQTEIGKSARALGIPVVAVVRRGVTLGWDDPGIDPVQAGDRLVHVSNNKS